MLCDVAMVVLVQIGAINSPRDVNIFWSTRAGESSIVSFTDVHRPWLTDKRLINNSDIADKLH